jgi:hypothetical protein
MSDEPTTTPTPTPTTLAAEAIVAMAVMMYDHVQDIPDTVTREDLKRSLVDSATLLVTIAHTLERVTAINSELREGLDEARAYVRRKREESNGKVEDHSGGEQPSDDSSC